MSSTNVTIVLVAAAFTVLYATLTSRVAPWIAAYFAQRLPHGDARHVHTLACHY
jgi:hypothetical protein